MVHVHCSQNINLISESRDTPLRSDDNIPFETVSQEKDEGFIVPNTYVARRADDSIDLSDIM